MFINSTRRVISSLENGKSVAISDQQVKFFTPYAMYPSFQVKELFYTEDQPQSLTTKHLDKEYDINVPQGAMRILILRMPTIKEMTDDLIKAGQEVPTDWSKFNLHATDTIDYLYVLSGQITCVINNEHIKLQAGDFITQIGAEHTWINEHNEACQLLATIVGTEKRPGLQPVKFD